MKKIITSILALTMAFSLMACSSTEETTTEVVESETAEVTETTEKPVLKVGMSADYPPFEYHELVDGTDTIVGADVDLANFIADELGYELQIVDMSFDGLIGSLNEGAFDMVISGLTISPERAEQILFSDAYYGFDNVVITTAENVDMFKSLEDLQGAKIAGLLGSVQEALAKGYAGETAVIVPNFQDMVLMLQEGGVDGIICDVDVAERIVVQNDAFAITDVVIKLENDSIGIGFQKEDTELCEAVNGVIEKAKTEGLLDEWMEYHKNAGAAE